MDERWGVHGIGPEVLRYIRENQESMQTGVSVP